MRQFLRLLPAALIMAVSCYLSSMPTVKVMPSFWSADKLVHVVCFGVFAFWVAFGCCSPVSRHCGGRRLWLWLAPVLFVAVYGATDELHQSFTPGRSCSFYDWCADFVGAAVGSYVHLWLLTSRHAVGRWWRGLAGAGLGPGA